MKRFTLVMHDELHSEFYRYFPDHGSRTNILRRCVRRLIERAKVTGQLWEAEVEQIADTLYEGGLPRPRPRPDGR